MRVTGLGNVQVGAKLRLWADPGGVPVLSILPTVNLPTASAERAWDPAMPTTRCVLTGTDFGTRGHVDVNYGIGSIGAGGGLPHFVQHLVSVSASLRGRRLESVPRELLVFAAGSEGGAVTAFDVGAIYTGSRLAVDGGSQIRRLRSAP